MSEFIHADRVHLVKIFEDFEEVYDHCNSFMPMYKVWIKNASEKAASPVKLGPKGEERERRIKLLKKKERDELELLDEEEGLYIMYVEPTEEEVIEETIKRIQNADSDLISYLANARAAKIPPLNVSDEKFLKLFVLNIMHDDPIGKFGE